jgi:hypothetical protein
LFLLYPQMNDPTNLTEIFEKSQVGPVLGTYLK